MIFAFICLILLFLIIQLFSSTTEESIYARSMLPPNEYLEKCPVTDGFDFPVGPPDADGYYVAQHFAENNHCGEDWNGNGGGNTDLGDDIFAVADGIVVFAQDIAAGWGMVIRILHKLDNDEKEIYVESLYGHVENVKLKQGNIVKRGQKIGTMGNLNGRYYAHLHLEIRTQTGLPIGGGYSRDRKGFVAASDFIKEHR